MVVGSILILTIASTCSKFQRLLAMMGTVHLSSLEETQLSCLHLHHSEQQEEEEEGEEEEEEEPQTLCHLIRILYGRRRRFIQLQ